METFEGIAWHIIRRALVRSRVRLRVLFALLRLGEAYIADVAREARATEARVRAAVWGDGDADYREAFSLFPMGLVASREDAYGTVLSLTPLGEHVAKVWQRATVRAVVGEPREAFA